MRPLVSVLRIRASAISFSDLFKAKKSTHAISRGLFFHALSKCVPHLTARHVKMSIKAFLLVWFCLQLTEALWVPNVYGQGHHLAVDQDDIKPIIYSGLLDFVLVKGASFGVLFLKMTKKLLFPIPL